MLWSFPFAWLLLTLPFVSAGLIARARPLREVSARHHRMTWTTGVLGLCAFLAGFAGLLPAAWTLAAVIVGGAVSGFACFWPAKPDDGGDDWRRWWIAPERLAEVRPASRRLGTPTARRTLTPDPRPLPSQHRQQRAQLDLGLGQLGHRVRVTHDPTAGVQVGQPASQ